MARCDLEVLQCGVQRRALHHGPVVGMQRELVGCDAFAVCVVADEVARVRLGLIGVDLPRHCLSAEEIEHDVQEPVLAPNRARQVSDVPTGHLVGPAGGQCTRQGALPRLSFEASVAQLLPASKYAVDCRFGGQIAALVGQAGDDLGRWQVSKFRRVDGRQNCLYFLWS